MFWSRRQNHVTNEVVYYNKSASSFSHYPSMAASFSWSHLTKSAGWTHPSPYILSNSGCYALNFLNDQYCSFTGDIKFKIAYPISMDVGWPKGSFTSVNLFIKQPECNDLLISIEFKERFALFNDHERFTLLTLFKAIKQAMDMVE